MPRKPRPDLAGIPQHIVQRGNNRQACFYRDSDYLRYLTNLREAAARYGCRVHAYVLMTNHVHLLVTPDEVGAVGRMMQLLGRHYVGYINVQYRRTGTLWEGRYRSCLVDSERYLLTCYRYIELNPVRAGMVADAATYPWSSHRYHVEGRPDSVIAPHPAYQALGQTEVERREAYRAIFSEPLDAKTLEAIRDYVQQQRALGSARFQAQIEEALGRCMSVRPAHRPRAERNGTL